MIALMRIIFLVPYFVLFCCAGCLFCLFRPMHKNNTKMVAKWLSKSSIFFGIKLITRTSTITPYTPQVFIGNHQNSYDLITISSALGDNTVSLGKKSILFIPFFGLLYWLSGNILIDRKNKKSAKKTINQVVDRMNNDQLSIWMFPEGTRSRGRGLLPFKMGAFHTAIKAGAPIVPIVLSSTNHIRVNKFNNGVVIAHVLDPIDTSQYTTRNAKELAEHCFEIMRKKIAELDLEVAELNNKR